MGLLGLAVEHGTLRRSFFAHVPPFVLIGAGVIIAMSRRDRIQVDAGVRRFAAILFPVRQHVSDEAPLKIILRAMFGLLRLDMSQAARPPSTRVSVDVTCLAGRVELIVPKKWDVQAGRIDLARHITFAGSLTRSDIAPPTELEDDEGKTLVVINVLGWGGVVLVQRT
jgi:hypothetical protein